MMIYAVRVPSFSDGPAIPYIQAFEAEETKVGFKLLGKVTGKAFSTAWHVGRVGKGGFIKSGQVSDCWSKGHFFYTESDARSRIEFQLDKMEKEADRLIDFIATTKMQLDAAEFKGE